jgi:transcriptional regulator with XRE-family HTH domain
MRAVDLRGSSTVRDLRKARALTQQLIAEAVHISQDGESRIEKLSDFLLSTLRSCEAMGGKLRLAVELPNRNANRRMNAHGYDLAGAHGKTGLSVFCVLHRPFMSPLFMSSA